MMLAFGSSVGQPPATGRPDMRSMRIMRTPAGAVKGTTSSPSIALTAKSLKIGTAMVPPCAAPPSERGSS